ncbi:MAG: ABC transporter ATP-binding protein/permease [Coriobacteriales bacterium]|jgi:ABC-type lipoprotein export system ATPase subunit|nr:ABC transporter ATP-binding protein/permease [Coriobacteriales bacterium]
MLQLTSVTKSYATAGFEQIALNSVSCAFRDNEFVAVLGPSGSGKTTLLNIIGGLDHYDSGDLVIDGVSTKRYKDRDWDTYRNNRIGFVFQSYNLIPHQTVLANVELALTLAGVSRSARRARARRALAEVGLSEHVNKKPNQLSGGQMQRVAIARALINDPEILLADEPTGALDTKTSEQIMALLTTIAHDRLVIMVTHNPELAESYATRTISLRDGHVESDTDPYEPEHRGLLGTTKGSRRARMSFLTAVSLSFNNLMTKKGRTIMTAFAGSIGIIGIAAILGLASGVNDYIKNIEENTLSSYPLSITSSSFDFTSLLSMGSSSSQGTGAGGSGQGGSGSGQGGAGQPDAETAAAQGIVREYGMLSGMFSNFGSNDLAALKLFLDSGESGIEPYINDIEYSYSITPQIFSPNTSDTPRQVNPDSTFSSLGLNNLGGSSLISMGGMSTGLFSQLVDDTGMIEQQYDVVAGRWPTEFNECLLVINSNNGISDYALYLMGLRDPNELDDMVEQLSRNEKIIVPESHLLIDYADILNVRFKLVYQTDYYRFDDTYGIWTSRRSDESYLKELIDTGPELRITGILRPKSTAPVTSLTAGVYYTPKLIDHLIDHNGRTQIVKDQLKSPDVNVLTGNRFGDEADRTAMEGFDMSKMFSIDTEAFSNLFNIDASAFSGLDLAGAFDPSMLTGPLPEMPPLDFSQLLGSIDVSSLPLEKLADFAINILLDYFGYAAEQGTVTDALQADFTDYLQQPGVSDSITQRLGGLIDSAELSQLGTQLLVLYLSEAFGGIPPTPQQLIDGFGPWLASSPNGQALLASSLPNVIDADGAAGLVNDVLADYLAYTGESGDLAAVLAADFASWLTTPETSALIALSFEEQIGLDSLLAPFEAAMGAYLQQVLQGYLMLLMSSMTEQLSSSLSASVEQLTASMADAMSIDESAFAEAFKFNVNEEELAGVVMSYMNTTEYTFDSNLRRLGFAQKDRPAGINIYPIDFESKQSVIEILDAYNERMKEAGLDDRVISYSDIVGALMSSVTDIINMISYVLVAFVAISLVVSSIMIGVITYISVLERRKEIGILRSIGASKGDIGSVFNAETLIVGLVAGILGIGITLLLSIPANIIVESQFDIANLVQLPVVPAVMLVVVSMALTFVSGLIPSSAASRKDPVEALRSE